MMNKKVILRQFKGLNLPDRKHNLWVYYFTLPTSKLLSSIPSNSKLNAHYSNFNFADVNIKVLVHQSTAIESNPSESLPALLNFNQPISQHYFKFCSLLLETNADKNIIAKIVDEASPQLIRSLLAFNYQFEREFANIQNKKESAFFPFHFLTDFSDLVKVLLKTTNFKFQEFLYLLTPILVLMFSDHDPKSIIYEATQKVYIVLLDFLQHYNCREDEILPIISFVINTSSYNKTDDDKYSNLCQLLSTNKSIFPYISEKSYTTFIKRSKYTFDKICKSKPDPKLFDLGLLMMKALASTLNKKNEPISREISPSILIFIEWSIRFDHLPTIELPTVQKRSIIDPLEFKTDYQFEFYDCDMFDKNLSPDNCGLRSVSPIYLANSIILTSVVGITAEICSKNETVLSDIMINIPRVSIVHLYVAVSIIFLCRPASVGELLTKTNTWDLFVNDSIINDKTLFGREGVDLNAINLKDLILSILFNLSTKDAAVSLCKLIDPNYPTVVYKVVELINIMLTSEFIKQSQESSLFDTLMYCYNSYRYYLVKHKNDQENEDIQYMKKSKSLILSFINTFSLCDESKFFIFSNYSRAYFVLSLLFEKNSFEMALDIVCRALETEYVNLLMRHLNKLIKFGFHHLDIVEWQELISVLIDCVSVSISVNEKNLMKSFLKSGSIYTFSRIPTAFSEIKNWQRSVLTVLHKIICFFTTLVQNMKNIIFYLSDPQWNFVPNLAKAIRSIGITQETVDLLINFTICSDTLWIKEGIELLMIAIEKNEVSKKILDFLINSTNNSIANRYQCFKANVITSLLSFIVKNSSCEKTVETVGDLNLLSLNLLKNICSTFFRVGELSLTVRLLPQIENNLTILLLDSLIELCEQQAQQSEDHNFTSQMDAIYSTTNKQKSKPKAFFHFNPLSVFKVNEFYLPAVFNISMKVYFPREYKNMKQLFLVTTPSGDQQIELKVVLNRFILELKNKTRENQFQLSNKVTIKQWFDLELALTASTVTLYINSNQETSSVIPKKFRFEHFVSFYIQNIDADIQSIKIFSKDYYIFSSYDAKIVNEGSVVNLDINSPIPNAEFYGISVPFSITFIDIIPSCGGPKIFLPLFENIKSVVVFKKLLQLLNSLICAREAIFDPSFFRSFAHLLSKIETDFFIEESLELILQIYKSIWNTPLRSAMLKYIFGNIDIWSRMNQQSQYLLFSNIFSGLFQIDSTLFVKTLNFHSLLLKFSLFFDQTFNNNQDAELNGKIMKETISFLFMISQRSFSPQDAKILTAAAMDINSDNMCIKSLHLIVNLIFDNSPGMIAYLKKYSFYQPFISILNSHLERTRIIAINCIYIVQCMLKDSLLSDELIDGIRLLNVIDMTQTTLFSLMSYMTKSVNSKLFPTIVDSFNLESTKPIYYPQFLPLFATIIALNKEEERNKYLSFVKKSVTDYEETRKSFACCNHWIFWFIFFGYVENQIDEWINLINLIILVNDSILTNVFNLIIYCDIFGLEISQSIEHILIESIEKKPSPKLALFIVNFILFKIKFNSKEKLNPDDSIHKFCQEFVLANCPTFSFKYDQQIFKNKDDLNMMISSIKYLIKSGLLFIKPQQNDQQPQPIINKTDSATNLQNLNSNEIKFDFNNKNETNLALISFSICLIAQQNKEESASLSNLLVSFIRKNESQIINRSEICKSLLLIYNFYIKNNMKESDSIIYTVRQIDPNYQTIISPEKMNTISDTIRTSFEKEIENLCLNFQKEFNSTISFYHKKEIDSVQRVFSEENQKLVQLRTNFTKKLGNSAQEQERFLKGNRKFYHHQLKEMNLQNGGPWFSIPSTPHFKFNFILDRIGRHNKMSVNFNFKDHKMASLLRDTGIETPTTTATTTNEQNDNNVKIIKGMRIDVSSEVESPNDFTIELECQMVKAAKYFKGKMYLTRSSIYFEVKQTTDAFGEIIDKMSKLIEINVENIRFILKRRYLFIDSACEVFTLYNKSYFFVFGSEQNRTKFFKEIESFKLKNIEFIQFGDAKKLFKDLQLQKKWNSGMLTNYEYLYWLNILSGRSIHDISQYPVFPWVISDYISNELNLQDENSFRDLSKPIGTLNQERLNNLKYLYNETRTAPYACLYRFHYSTPAYVISYLLRNEPFTSLHIQLQNGKFDNPNRLVTSIPLAWDSITSINSDFRELIPEFFATPEFLLNSEHYDLGCRTELVPLQKAATSESKLPELNKPEAENEQAQAASSYQSLPDLMKNEKDENSPIAENNKYKPNEDASMNNDELENKESSPNEINAEKKEVSESVENRENAEKKEGSESVENRENAEKKEGSESVENRENAEKKEGSESVETNKDSDVKDNESKQELSKEETSPNASNKTSPPSRRYIPKSKVVKGKNGQLLVNTEIPVDDISLPPWAPTASGFVAINRIALESPIVSSNLHNWIDLIFGSKQRSEEADNLFHPFSYLSTFMDDPNLTQIIQQHAANFGITPFQLFTKNHPKRCFIPKSHVLNTRKQLFFKSHCLQEFSTQDSQSSQPTSAKSYNYEDDEEFRQRNLNARERTKEKVMKIASKSGTFYALFADGTFRSFTFNEKHQLVPNKTSSLGITTQLKQDRVFIDTKNKSIILSPPWSQSFGRIHKTSIQEPRLTHATIVTSIAISNDGSYCATGAGDASLIVWDLSVIEDIKIQCHVVAHTESISTVVISSELEVVASCDEGGTFILSDLKTGTFLRKMKFTNHPNRMLISDLGFVVLIFSDLTDADDGFVNDKKVVSNSNDSRKQTKIVLVDLGGRKINEIEIEGKSTASCILSNDDSTAFLCIAQETKIVYIMRIYDLKIVAMGPVKETVIDISYCKEDLALYLLLANNSVHLTKLNV